MTEAVIFRKNIYGGLKAPELLFYDWLVADAISLFKRTSENKNS